MNVPGRNIDAAQFWYILRQVSRAISEVGRQDWSLSKAAVAVRPGDIDNVQNFWEACMPNQYDSTKRTIGGLLSMTSPPIRVPDWQRNYSWTTTEIEAFWLDLEAFSTRYPGDTITTQEYFLGSVVLVLEPTSHLLLDGQQRTATATILLSVIRDHVKQFRDNAASRISQRFISDYNDALDSHTYKLTLNRYDRDFFRQLIQEDRGADDEEPTPALLSHRLIGQAHEYFHRKFEERYEELGGGRPAFRWALRVQQVLTDHVSVVVVMSEDEDNAASVFETLNDRGIGLSTPDLLRNLIIRRATEEDREEIIDCWQDVLEVGEEAKVEDFLRHHWLSRNGDVKTRRLYREIKESVEDNNVDSLDFSRELRRSAGQYRDLVSARHDVPEIAHLLKDVDGLGAKALLPAALSAVDVGVDDDVQNLLDALVVFFVRHNIIGNLEKL